MSFFIKASKRISQTKKELEGYFRKHGHKVKVYIEVEYLKK